MAATVDVKSAFNIKVLKRHDAAIDSIVHSASFVVLYLYDTRKGAWSKTGIEGPMFLYHRTQAPHYGMFLLNRNGVDNFSVPLTKDDDLELTEEFVILRTEDATSLGEEDDEEDDEKIIGVWVFEKDQRQIVGNEMLRLQSLAAKEDAAPSASTRNSSVSSTSQPQAQPASISLDALFASASQPASSPRPPPPQQQPPAPSTSSAGSGPALLDAIFQSASSPSPRPSPQPSAPPPAPPSAPSAPATSSSSSSDAAAGLMAMLGLGSSAKPSAPPAPSEKQDNSSSSQDSPATGAGILPAGLQTLFSSAAAALPSASASGSSSSNKEASNSTNGNGVKPAVDPPTGPKRASTPTGPKASQNRTPAQGKRNAAAYSPVKSAAPLSAPTGPKASSKPREAQSQSPQQAAAAPAPAPASSFRDTSTEAINGQMAKHEEQKKSTGANDPPLSKTEFMRELLGLIHTDKTFTTNLYEAYLSRQRR